jgi:uncharacterized SAM-binding protein YcdF (DUF218 family)
MIVLAIVVSLVYIVAAGGSYEMHTRWFVGEEVSLDDVEVRMDDEGVVEYTGMRVEDSREVVLSFKAISKGKTNVYFGNFNDSDAARISTELSVSSVGVIVEERNGAITFNGFRVVIFHIEFIFLLTTIIMIVSFIECHRKALYSYSMIAYGGIGLYQFFLFAFSFYKMMNNVVTNFSIFAEIIYEVGRLFLTLMTPVMFILACAVSISNIWLMKNEGYRPVNALGIAISVLWGAGLVLALNRVYHFLYIPILSDVHVISDTMTFVLCYFECMFLSTALSAALASRHTPPYDRDCVIILGCGIRRDGTLTPLLRGRVDSALSFVKKQKEATGKDVAYVPSGGQGSDEIISESEAMSRYLLEQGIPQESILKEDRSTNTFENMKFSKEVIEKAVGDIKNKKIAFATTNYHIFRGYILARKNGFEAQGISAKTKWYFFPNAFLREFIGLLYDKLLFHMIFLLFIVSIVVTMALR